MLLVACLLCISILLSIVSTRSQLSDLSDVTFPTGITYSFNPSHNYVVLQRQGEYMHLEDVKVFNGESELDKSTLLYTWSSVGSHSMAYCYIYDSGTNQTICHTDDGDNTPLLIVDIGENIFNRVKIYNRRDGVQSIQDRILDVYLQFWIQGTLDYQMKFSDVAKSPVPQRYTLPCPFYAIFNGTGCICEEHYQGSSASYCTLPLHRYSFIDFSDSSNSTTTISDMADVTQYNGSLINGKIDGTVEIQTGEATFSGQGRVIFSDDLLENSRIISVELWVTTSNELNTEDNAIIAFNNDNTGDFFILLRAKTNETVDSQQLYANKLYGSYGSSFLQSTNVDFSAMNMTHIVYIVDPETTESVKLYSNGALVGNRSGVSVEIPRDGSWRTELGGTASQLFYGSVHEFTVLRGGLSDIDIAARYAAGFEIHTGPTPLPTSPTPFPTPSPTMEPTVAPSSSSPTVGTYAMTTVAGEFTCERPANVRKMTFGKCLSSIAYGTVDRLAGINFTFNSVSENSVFEPTMTTYALEDPNSGSMKNYSIHFYGKNTDEYPSIPDNSYYSPTRIHVNSVIGSPSISLTALDRVTFTVSHKMQYYVSRTLLVGDIRFDDIPKLPADIFLSYQIHLLQGESVVIDSFVVHDVELINRFTASGITVTDIPSAIPTMSPAPTEPSQSIEFPPVHGGNIGVP